MIGDIHNFLHGALAQLGERYTGSVEVSGSIPLCSTTETLEKSGVLLLSKICIKGKYVKLLTFF
jgi:hypothetical protein